MERIQDWVESGDPLLLSILIVVGGILIGIILKFIVLRVLKTYQKNTDFILFASFIKHLNNPLTLFLPLLFISLLLPMVSMDKGVYTTISKTVQTLLIIAFCWLLINLIYVFEDYMYHKYQIDKADNLQERKIRTQLQFIKRVVVIGIFIIGVSVILLSFENVRRLGAGLLTSAGIAGVIIGFAAQRSLANLLAGFQIAFTQPIKIDDAVVVEGEWGRIEEITLTYVVLKLWDQRRLILPITYFIEKPFQNWTRTTSDLLGTVILYTDYTIPIQPIKDELRRIVEASPLWDKKTQVLQVTNCSDKTIELRALISAANSSNIWDLRCEVREKLIDFIQNNYPHCLPKSRAELSDKNIEELKVDLSIRKNWN